MKITVSVLTTLLLLAACGGEDAAASRSTDRTTAARALISSFAQELQGELKGALASGGPVEAISICSERAPAIAAASAREGLTIRRIGTRVRNRETNVPTAAELAILERFQDVPEDERADAFEIVESSESWKFYKPIFVTDAVCLTCHGPRDSIAPAIRQAIAERYPDDEATGYALGDLRGAFVVEAAR